jgi:HK97 gp10 family phage protein
LASFSFDTSKFHSVKVMEKELKRAVFATMKFYQGPAEAYMKHHAPWRDRTTNARNGLKARARKSARLFVLILFHTVDYGIYLERGTENMRARPIIRPTIAIYAPKVVVTLTKILDRL